MVAVGVGVTSGPWGHKLGPERGGERGESWEERRVSQSQGSSDPASSWPGEVNRGQREEGQGERGLRRREDWTRRQDALLQPAAPPASTAPLGKF